jgi:hypothetical protein
MGKRPLLERIELLEAQLELAEELWSRLALTSAGLLDRR